MKIEKPIFIIGVERSGTTLLYSILSNHPALYWFSRLDSLIPTATILATLTRRFVNTVTQGDVYVAVPEAISRSRGLIPPSECLPYWRMLFEFVDESDEEDQGDDYSTDKDLNPQTIIRVRRDLEKRLTLLGKKRLLLKAPAFSVKIGYFNKMFPDALFIHIIRHPFTNFNSLLRAKQASSKKYWGTKYPGWKAVRDASLDVQASMHMKELLDIIDRDIQSHEGLSSRFLRVKYEDLIDNPDNTVTQVINFCGLYGSQEIFLALKDIVGKSQKHIGKPTSQVAIDILTPLVSRYGYDIPMCD